MNINKVKESKKLLLIKKDWRWILKIDVPTDEMYISCIGQNSSAIQFFPEDISNKVKWRYLKAKPGNIGHLEYTTSEMQKYVIDRSVGSFKLIKNITDEALLYAIKKRPKLIRDVTNPSFAVQREAVNTSIGLLSCSKSKQYYYNSNSIYPYEIHPDIPRLDELILLMGKWHWENTFEVLVKTNKEAFDIIEKKVNIKRSACADDIEFCRLASETCNIIRLLPNPTADMVIGCLQGKPNYYTHSLISKEHYKNPRVQYQLSKDYYSIHKLRFMKPLHTKARSNFIDMVLNKAKEGKLKMSRQSHSYGEWGIKTHFRILNLTRDEWCKLISFDPTLYTLVPKRKRTQELELIAKLT